MEQDIIKLIKIDLAKTKDEIRITSQILKDKIEQIQYYIEKLEE